MEPEDVPRRLADLAGELVASGLARQAHVLAGPASGAAADAAFVLQVDDYEIRVQVRAAPDGAPALSAADLPALQDLLAAHPGTTALVLAWTAAGLPAVPLSLTRLRALLAEPARIGALLRAAAPLPEVVQGLVRRQVRHWLGEDEGPAGEAAAPLPAAALFEQAIGATIDAERGRAYRFEERKRAAEDFPAAAETRLLIGVLSDALAGAPVADLVARLTRLPGGERP